MIIALFLFAAVFLPALPCMEVSAAQAPDGADGFPAQSEAAGRYAEESVSMTAAERRDAHIRSAAISIALALLIPAIVVSVWTAQLKTVRPKDTAADYVQPGSLNLSVQRDIFLYRRISKIPRSQSSGGGRGGRKFR